MHLQPIEDIHLRSGKIRDLETHGNIMNVYLYAAVAGIILLIACINFMNLYTVRRRTKEIGIRKVLGANFQNTTVTLIKDFVKLILISYVFAIPAAHFGMNRWLQNFSYRAGVGFEPFISYLLQFSLFIISFLPENNFIFQISYK